MLMYVCTYVSTLLLILGHFICLNMLCHIVGWQKSSLVTEYMKWAFQNFEETKVNNLYAHIYVYDWPSNVEHI